MFGNEKIHPAGRITCVDSILNEDGGCSKDVKRREAKAQSIFSQLKKVWNNRKMIRILEAMVMSK